MPSETRSAACADAMNEFTRVLSAQSDEDNRVEEQQSRRMTVAVKQGDAAMQTESDRETIEDDVREIAERKQADLALARMKAACKDSK
jgi:peroxiredoxin